MPRIRHTSLSGVTDVIVTTASIMADPYFPEIICRANQLAAINNGRAVPPCNRTAGSPHSPNGLKTVMPGLRGYVYAEANPWVYPVAIAAAVGIPFLLGYLVAQR